MDLPTVNYRVSPAPARGPCAGCETPASPTGAGRTWQRPWSTRSGAAPPGCSATASAAMPSASCQLPAPNDLRAAYVVGSGAGWSGWMTRREALRAELLWKVLGPVIAAALGYLPLSRFRMGEDIPLGVYRDWKRWCANPRYFFDDSAPDAVAITAPFADARIPIAAVVVTDDAWAPPASRDAFFAGYRAADIHPIDPDTGSAGCGRGRAHGAIPPGRRSCAVAPHAAVARPARHDARVRQLCLLSAHAMPR